MSVYVKCFVSIRGFNYLKLLDKEPGGPKHVAGKLDNWGVFRKYSVLCWFLIVCGISTSQQPSKY